MLLNTECYEHCPELVAAYRAAGAEILAALANGVALAVIAMSFGLMVSL